MENKCPICNLELKTIPAGVSKKTGRPYKSFQSCPNRCPKAQYGTPNVFQNAPQGSTTNLNGNSDVYDLLTTLVAKVNAIHDKISKLSILDENPGDGF